MSVTRMAFQSNTIGNKDRHMDNLKKLIREIPDYPKPGILFYDITTLLQDKTGFHEMVDKLCNHYDGQQVEKVPGPEPPRLHFPPRLALPLKPGFHPNRKQKKPPRKTPE